VKGSKATQTPREKASRNLSLGICWGKGNLFLSVRLRRGAEKARRRETQLDAILGRGETMEGRKIRPSEGEVERGFLFTRASKTHKSWNHIVLTRIASRGREKRGETLSWEIFAKIAGERKAESGCGQATRFGTERRRAIQVLCIDAA